ncbi:sensor histidine kinase [Priestia megaterium]|uniref:histidine kinase n=2 Tax=Priestia megaterium TaxID=1404 RepID=A0A3D8WUJ6_PRIMG|nr:HAMP domain-containing sensor histidine kinase [Priestia megaterium]MDH3169029.1 HAMP domain-containing sensor histidine kinase [Priestia megaterium]RDZ06451.1 sensor histidine kinase [Priestia megaterium]
MKTKDHANKISRPPVNLNTKLFLIFIICLIVSVLTFYLFVFMNPQFEDIRDQQTEQQKEEENIKKLLVQLTHSFEKKHINLDDVDSIASTINPVTDNHPRLGFLVANAKGDVLFHSNNKKIRSTNIQYLLKQKLAAESTDDSSSNPHYSSFISLLSLQGDIGYLIIEGPSFEPSFNPTKYIYQVYIGLGCSVLVFFILFLLCTRPITRYIKQIEGGISRIVNKDWTYSIPVKGKNELSFLARNINWMTEQMRQRFEKERKVEQAKNELITNLSHDLRTPLTSIIGYLTLVKDKQYKNSEELEQYIQTTYSISFKLKNLLDELFEYTKLSLPDVDMQFQKVDLGGLLYQLVGEYTPIFENRGLDVKVKIPDDAVFISIDIEKIIRVFDNLLSNAEKYSHESGEIGITLRTNEEQVITSISNNTDQIDSEELSHLFERFYRMDKARSSKIAGSGVGLSIAKRIVELHQGEIWAESEQNKITMYVTLPLHHDTTEKEAVYAG